MIGGGNWEGLMPDGWGVWKGNFFKIKKKEKKGKKEEVAV